jgi:hypothetical protein
MEARPDTTQIFESYFEDFPDSQRIPAMTVERPFFKIRENPDFLALENHVLNNWRNDLANLGEVAPSEGALTLYFKAAQVMPREEYVRFLLALVPYVVEGSVPHQQFYWCLSPTSKQLRDIWVDYPLDKDRESLAKAAVGIFTEDKSKQQFFEDVISGAVAKRHADFEKDYYGEAPSAVREHNRPEKTELTNSLKHDGSRDNNTANTIDPKKTLHLQWLIVGIASLGILALIFKVWKGKAKR